MAIEKRETLFKKIGGKETLVKVVDVLYEKILSDPSINIFYKGIDTQKEKNRDRVFLSYALNGPVIFKGENKLGPIIKLENNDATKENINLVFDHLLITLEELRLHSKLISEVITKVSGENNTPAAMIDINQNNTTINNVKNMSEMSNKIEKQESQLMSAIDAGWAYIEFTPNGEILTANNNFANTLGYPSAAEFLGQHHRVFCSTEYANSNEYKTFWENLQKGIMQSGEFERISKNGESVWINASYTPVMDDTGKVMKIIKIASDITPMVKDREQSKAIQTAVDSGWASIEFTPDGIVTHANQNFVNALGYTKEAELLGHHHRMFCSPELANSSEYRDFWTSLGKGEIQSGEYERISKNGESVWINASYSPVLNDKGQVIKIIKIATEITEMITTRAQADAIQTAVDTGWASIEFNSEGIITSVNDNFTKTLGYNSGSELIGKHHQIFCEQNYVNSADYKAFWNNLANGEIQAGEFERFKKDGNSIWINASYAPIKDANGKVYKIIKIASEITNVKKPILAVAEVLKSMASGDLTFKYKADNAADYVEEMGSALNLAIENTHSILYSISEVTSLIASSSEELLTKADQMQGTTQEVASAIQQMAEGAHQQASQTDEASKLVEGVLETANDMGTKADQINKAADNGQTSSKQGLITIKQVVENMAEIQVSADTTSDSINVLNERSEEIAITLNVITDIAAQTNLLALNAAIEAARAGEAGRGFAVVAEEIRKLAEDSRKSAIDIQKVISAVQKDVNQAGKAIDKMGLSVKNGSQASQEAEKVFFVIEQSTSETYALSEDIQRATDVQKESINSTVKNIEQIVVVSEETASGTEEVATSSKELSRGMEEVATTSQQLADIATKLQEGVSRFTLTK